MLNHTGTGVSTYARVLASTQSRLSDCHGTLNASPALLPPALGALGRRTRKTELVQDGNLPAFQLKAPDIFRRAHVHFGLYGTLMPVLPAMPYGIMHWTYPVPLFFRNWINIYAIHDIIPIIQPQLSPVSAGRLHKTLKAIAAVADAVTTISDASRADIIAIGLFRQDRVINTSLTIEAPSTKVRLAINPPALAQAGLRHKDYLLFSGSVEARKNVQLMLAAYRAAQIDMPLVIVGPTTDAGSAIEADISATPGAIRLPYQTREALDALMFGARALIFPSLAEGFGLPVLEAMARNTAVVASRIPVISEVTGEAALLVSPTDIGEMAQAIRQLATNADFAAALAAKSAARARLFSIESFATKVSDVYHIVHADRGGDQGVSRST